MIKKNRMLTLAREDREMRIIVADDRDFVAELITNRLRESPVVDLCMRAPRKADTAAEDLISGFAELLRKNIDAVVYSPPQRARNSIAPDLESAESIFQ